MPKTKSTSKSWRIASNSLILFARMTAITVINLYAVRLLLQALGQEDFGTFNAVAGVVLVSSFITGTLAIGIQRFYSYTLGEGKNDRLSDIFSASINIIVVLTVVLFVLFETIGLWFVNTQMSISPERLDAAKWVFHFSLATMLFGLLQLPFTAAIFAHEDMGLFAIISLTECLLRLVVTLLIGVSAMDGLKFYAVGLFVVSVVIFAIYAFMAHHRYSECCYYRWNQSGVYKSLLSFSGWTMYSAIAGVGVTQGMTILLYVFFGPLATAAYAIAIQVLHAFQTLSNSIVVAFRPAMVKAYAERNFVFLDKLFVANNKFIFYLLLVVAIPLVLELRTIFGWWLGDVSEDTIVYSRLVILYMVFMSMHNPVTTIVQATGRVKLYCLCVESVILCSLPATWLAFRLGAPSEACVVIMILSCLLAHIVRLFILHKLYPQFRFTPYLCGVVLPGGLSAMITALVVFGVHYIMTPSALKVFITFAAAAFVMLFSVYAFGVSKEERQMIRKFMFARIAV